jgi:hypothetical protein
VRTFLLYLYNFSSYFTNIVFCLIFRFDNIPNIRRFLQKQIEGQLRNMFQDDLPQLIHNLSIMLLNKKEKLNLTPSHVKSESNQQLQNENKQDESPKMSSVNGTDTYSIDSGYMSDDMVSRFVNRPHHLKWSGNEPIMLDDYDEEVYSTGGYILHRYLGPKEEYKSGGGLQKILGESLVLQPKAKTVTRTSSSIRIPQKTRSIPSIIVKSTSSTKLDPSSILNLPPNSPSYSYSNILNSAPVPLSSEVSASDKEYALSPTESNKFILHRNSSFISETRSDYSGENASSSLFSTNASSRYRAWSAGPFQRNIPYSSPGGPRSDSGLRNPASPQTNEDLYSGDQSEITDKVVLQPSDNEVAAHLASLMHAHHTMAPLTHHLQHATFRTLPHHQHQHHLHHQNLSPSSPSPYLGSPNLANGNLSQAAQQISPTIGSSTSSPGFARRRIGTRTVRRLTLPNGINIPGISPSPSTSFVNSPRLRSESSSYSQSASSRSSTSFSTRSQITINTSQIDNSSSGGDSQNVIIPIRRPSTSSGSVRSSSSVATLKAKVVAAVGRASSSHSLSPSHHAQSSGVSSPTLTRSTSNQ